MPKESCPGEGVMKHAETITLVWRVLACSQVCISSSSLEAVGFGVL